MSKCSIKAHVFPDLRGLERRLKDSLKKDYSATRESYKLVSIIRGTAIEFLDLREKGAGVFKNVKADDGICFRVGNSAIDGDILIAWDEHSLLFNSPKDRDSGPPPLQFSRELRWWDLSDETSKSIRSEDDGWFVTSAFAQTLPVTSYDKLRLELSSPDPNVRVRARQFLGEHFTDYSNNVLSDLMAKNGDPNLIVSLLHGLITGIDNAEEGRHVPKAGWEIGKTASLPFIQGKEDNILDLVTVDDESVKKQVRRLVQRFPYDIFRDSFERLFEKYHVQQDGKENKRNGANQSLIYAFSFFTYNQMVQIALNNNKLSKRSLKRSRALRMSRKNLLCVSMILSISILQSSTMVERLSMRRTRH